MTAAESSVGDSGRVAGLLCLRDSLRKAKLPILLLGGFWEPFITTAGIVAQPGTKVSYQSKNESALTSYATF